MSGERKVIIIAGPNGAGKTTFAPETAAVHAGRVMLLELARHFAARQSFAFETTLAGRGYLHHIPEDTIRRRFAAGRENFERLYAPQVDAWALYDNSGQQPVLLDWTEKP